MTENPISGLIQAPQTAPEGNETEEKPPSAPVEAPETPLVESQNTSGTENSTTSEPVLTPAPSNVPLTALQRLEQLLGDGIGHRSCFKMMVFSEPGQTKSSFAATAPNNMIIDFEDGLISAKNSPNGIAENVRPMPYVNFEQLESLVYELGNGAFPDMKVLTIDTMTNFGGRSLEEITERRWRIQPSRNRYVPDTDDHQENNQKLERFVRALTDLNRDLIILCHARTVEPKGKPSKTFPDFSERLANKLEAMMDVVGYMELKELDDGNGGKIISPVMTVKTAEQIHCKTRLPLPNQLLNPTWPELKAVWQKSVNEANNG